MSDEELLKLLEANGKLPVPYFDAMPVTIESGDMTSIEALPVLKRFLTLNHENRLEDSKHVRAYFDNIERIIGWESELAKQMTRRPSSDFDIWNFVQPRALFCGYERDLKSDGEIIPYMVLEAEVDWEPEHGLLMSWRNGNRLVRVSPFDGHWTNGHAYADAQQDDQIYCDF